VRSLPELKFLAAFAVVCAAALILTRRTEHYSTDVSSSSEIPAGRKFSLARTSPRPALFVAAFALVPLILAAFVFAAFTLSDTSTDGRPQQAATAPRTPAAPAKVSAYAVPAVEPLPAGANAYWYARAREVGEKHFLGDLFVRQITQESGFQDEVISGQRVSWAGAEGIAQIMREHHPWIDPLKPDEALDYAARHMLDLLLRFDGDAVKALAAYNAGAGTVEWAVEFAGHDWFAWIPWETQEYTTAILRPGEQGLLPNWGQVKQWWSRTAEHIERPLQLRLLQGRTIAVGALPEPVPAC
jgi:Transglycosylase SLT domain